MFTRGFIISVFIFSSTTTYGDALFPVGSENKARGMSSSLSSRRASAVLYNPANLTLNRGRRAYVETGVAAVSYSYEHPQFDPVVINATSPLVVAGYSGRLIGRTYFGLIALPTAAGEVEIPGVPRDISGSTMPVVVRRKDEGMQLGTGIGYTLTKSFRLGLSAIYEQEKQNLDANLVGNESSLLSYSTTHRSVHPRLGLFGDWGRWRGGFSVTPKRTKEYQGDYRRASDGETTEPPQVGFVPTTVRLGTSYQINRQFRVQADGNYRRWSEGRTVFSGERSEFGEADLQDVIETGASIDVRFRKNMVANAGLAYRPSPWGDGSLAEDQAVDGVDFGRMDGITQSVAALGGRVAFSKKSTLKVAVLHGRGAREAGVGSAHEGRYQIAVTTLTGSIDAEF